MLKNNNNKKNEPKVKNLNASMLYVPIFFLSKSFPSLLAPHSTHLFPDLKVFLHRKRDELVS